MCMYFFHCTVFVFVCFMNNGIVILNFSPFYFKFKKGKVLLQGKIVGIYVHTFPGS